MVPVISYPIKDEIAFNKILKRIHQEGIKIKVNSAGIIQVKNEQTAKTIRGILIMEDLIPVDTDPWAIFDRERWVITDVVRNAYLQKALTKMVTDHIKALDDIEDVNLTIVIPVNRLFASEPNPVTASIIIKPKQESDIRSNRKKIEGIQKLIKFAIEGLKDENIVITDHTGLILNDFADMREEDHLNNEETDSEYLMEDIKC